MIQHLGNYLSDEQILQNEFWKSLYELLAVNCKLFSTINVLLLDFPINFTNKEMKE